MSALKERLRGRLWAAERQRLLPQTQLRLLEVRGGGGPSDGTGSIASRFLASWFGHLLLGSVRF